MITKFHIYEAYKPEEPVVDIGYGIFFYKNIFFSKEKGAKQFSQKNINEFLRNRNANLFDVMMGQNVETEDPRRLQMLLRKLYDGDMGITKEIGDKIIDWFDKRNYLEKMAIIHRIIFDVIDHEDEDNPNNEPTFEFLSRKELKKPMLLFNRWWEKGWNKKLGSKMLGKTFDEALENIDKFYMEEEMKKFNL